MRHFLRDDDLTPKEQHEVLDLALRLKQDRFAELPLAGPKTALVMFDKTSTRTRVSFAVGISDLGGSALIVNPGEAQLGEKESISDTAIIFSRMTELIVWRTGAHKNIELMAKHASVPVINSLTDDFHPCQVLADLLTVREHKDELQGLTAAYVGDAANNMAHSYLLGFATAGINLRLAGPEGYLPRKDILAKAEQIAEQTGSTITVSNDPREAVTGADIVITDTWISMGQEAEEAARLQHFNGYCVDEELFGLAKDDAIFLHCLPAYRGFEVSAEVIDGPRSVVWDEAENRVHAQKALMVWLLRQAKQSE